jgi:pantothenate kinase
MTFQTEINGLPVLAVFSEENVEGIFLPLLKHLTKLQNTLNRRILVFLAAPPGAGKSTLSEFLRYLSVNTPGVTPVTITGMDGFHRRQEYLLSHTAVRDGKEIPMVEIKGAPVTFDLELFHRSVQRAAAGEEMEWPDYDRTLHNPVYRGRRVTGNIVLLEGNYLLLDEEGWRDLRAYADYTIKITADPEILKKRLVDRKATSGMAREKAEAFVMFSDLYNARLCLERSGKADLELRLLKDDHYEKI